MKLILALVAVALAGCGTVRKPDLDAWVGVPVEALDTHTFFLTLPMYRTVSSSGIEIRNYSNSRTVASCFGSGSGVVNRGYVNSNAFTTCSSNRVECNNIFYIRDGKVLEYAPTGRCMTNDSVRPQQRYLDLQRKP